MNLGKLLGAGKTFFGGCKTAEYRQNKQVYLPKFNAEKNPFAPKAPSPAKPPEVSAADKIYAALAAGTRNNSVLPAAKPVRAAGWTARLNPFRAPEPVAPLAVNAVQAELSLDAVKVLHNDLSDADVEVVPMKSRSVASAAMQSGLLGGHQLNTV
jgi:hypothetical protein